MTESDDSIDGLIEVDGTRWRRSSSESFAGELSSTPSSEHPGSPLPQPAPGSSIDASDGETAIKYDRQGDSAPGETVVQYDPTESWLSASGERMADALALIDQRGLDEEVERAAPVIALVDEIGPDAVTRFTAADVDESSSIVFNKSDQVEVDIGGSRALGMLLESEQRTPASSPDLRSLELLGPDLDDRLAPFETTLMVRTPEIRDSLDEVREFARPLSDAADLTEETTVRTRTEQRNVGVDGTVVSMYSGPVAPLCRKIGSDTADPRSVGAGRPSSSASGRATDDQAPDAGEREERIERLRDQLRDRSADGTTESANTHSPDVAVLWDLPGESAVPETIESAVGAVVTGGDLADGTGATPVRDAVRGEAARQADHEQASVGWPRLADPRGIGAGGADPERR